MTQKQFLIVGLVWVGLIVLLVYRNGLSEPRIEYGITVLQDGREKVECEFDPPITIIINVMHYYDNYVELNVDYMTSTGNIDPVWGWSRCEWQPDSNAAFCDVYTLLPEYVTEDKAMDTIGHEVVHGSCGDFHE